MSRPVLLNAAAVTALMLSLIGCGKPKYEAFEVTPEDAPGERFLFSAGDASISSPKYRHVRGTPMVWNPYQGWQHLNTETDKFAEQISVIHMNTAIDAIEDRESSSKSKTGTYVISYNPKVEHMLMEGMEYPLKASLT